ncbi:MAG: hypothetical protein OXR62_03270 [Ahrensia sp.]|nr:hypothetical protein [Ahrensia sp.]
MIRAFAIPVAAAILLSIAAPAASDHSTNFHCSGFPVKSDRAKQAMKRLTHNATMRNIVLAYVYQWENEEIRRICDAAAAGETADLSCLDGRRDWEAIGSKIPADLADKSNRQLRPHMLDLQAQGFNAVKRREVLDYCEGLGVIDLKVKG